MSKEEAIEELKKYIKLDIVYQKYKNTGRVDGDFDKFCIKHCESIEVVLKHLQEQE